MLYKYFTEKLTGLQGLSIEKVEENQNTIHIHCKLERKTHKCPCCGKALPYRKHSGCLLYTSALPQVCLTALAMRH